MWLIESEEIFISIGEELMSPVHTIRGGKGVLEGEEWIKFDGRV